MRVCVSASRVSPALACSGNGGRVHALHGGRLNSDGSNTSMMFPSKAERTVQVLPSSSNEITTRPFLSPVLKVTLLASLPLAPPAARLKIAATLFFFCWYGNASALLPLPFFLLSNFPFLPRALAPSGVLHPNKAEVSFLRWAISALRERWARSFCKLRVLSSFCFADKKNGFEVINHLR